MCGVRYRGQFRQPLEILTPLHGTHVTIHFFSQITFFFFNFLFPSVATQMTFINRKYVLPKYQLQGPHRLISQRLLPSASQGIPRRCGTQERRDETVHTTRPSPAPPSAASARQSLSIGQSKVTRSRGNCPYNSVFWHNPFNNRVRQERVRKYGEQICARISE